MRFVTLGLLMAAVVTSASGQDKDAKPFRVLDIPAREHGYGNFETQVITSQEQLDALLKAKGDAGWNNKEGFVAGLKKAKIDFAKEALVLLRNTEGSGSTKVTLQPPEVKDKTTLVCQVKRVVPEIGTADIADYCFALAVQRGRILEVRYEVQGQKAVTLAVKK